MVMVRGRLRRRTGRLAMERTHLLERRRDAPAVSTYLAPPGILPVSTLRLGRQSAADTAAQPHSHNFPVLAYFEQGGGALRIADREWWVEAGDVYVVAPGEIVEICDTSSFPQAAGWAVFFPAEILGPRTPGAYLTWRAHPLLFPFVRGLAGRGHRLRVPPRSRAAWSGRIRALDTELRQRGDGYQEAAIAHLKLLLVELSRLAPEVVNDLRLKDEPLLAAVFGVIEERYCEPISLRDVARAVGLSSGHLTTVIRRKTGRTVLEWITERRLAEARRMLVETDLAVEEIGRKVGYGEASYFVRSFRRTFGTTPAGWRRASRPQTRGPTHVEVVGPRRERDRPTRRSRAPTRPRSQRNHE